MFSYAGYLMLFFFVACSLAVFSRVARISPRSALPALPHSPRRQEIGRSLDFSRKVFKNAACGRSLDGCPPKRALDRAKPRSHPEALTSRLRCVRTESSLPRGFPSPVVYGYSGEAPGEAPPPNRPNTGLDADHCTRGGFAPTPPELSEDKLHGLSRLPSFSQAQGSRLKLLMRGLSQAQGSRLKAQASHASFIKPVFRSPIAVLIAANSGRSSPPQPSC